MVGVVALGMAVGAVLASSLVSLRMSTKVLPVGILMGLAFFCMPFVTNYKIAIVMLIIIGACGGFFVVPMNALLQHRGHVLMGAGHSISVQNFNENLSILLMNALYAYLIFVHLPINAILVFFGLLVAVMMYVIKVWHAANQKRYNVMEQIKDFH
jgi:phosphatidylglycerophosphate synthase